MKKILLRNDDVLMLTTTTKHQVAAQKKKSFFEWFVESDKIFEEYDCPSVLAVLAEGIDVYPEWVKYIKERQHRFRIELHGYTHLWYHRLSSEDGYRTLKYAKDKIEDTFGVHVSTWYIPFCGKSWSVSWRREVCERLGVRFDVLDDLDTVYQHRYHYWNPLEVEKVKGMVKHQLSNIVSYA